MSLLGCSLAPGDEGRKRRRTMKIRKPKRMKRRNTRKDWLKKYKKVDKTDRRTQGGEEKRGRNCNLRRQRKRSQHRDKGKP